MLRSLTEPEGYRLDAIDGEIGRCKDFLFDDQRWTLRYMVADTGGWLSGRQVLISPAQLDSPDWQLQRLPVKLTREQIEQSPPLETDAPVSRRYEQAYNRFHALPDYWLGSGLWGDFPLPSGLKLRLLRPAWPRLLKARYREVKRLGDWLGDAHDLAVLAEMFDGVEDLDPRGEHEQLLLALAAQVRGPLRSRAHRLGARLYAEKPKHLERRMRSYWLRARTEGAVD